MRINLIHLIVFLGFALNIKAQLLDYDATWVGNDLPGEPFWVPHDVMDIYISSDGHVYTNVDWEENGANISEFGPDGSYLQMASFNTPHSLDHLFHFLS